jgi:hypothetical protein
VNIDLRGFSEEDRLYIEARTLKSLAEAERFLEEVSRAVRSVWPGVRAVRGSRPWEEMGLARRTYYARKKEGKL